MFLDTASLTPGEQWTQQLHQELKQSATVLLMASEAAIASPTVNQELGIAMANGAAIVPLVWDMTPSELPEWIRRYQAVVLTGKTQAEAVGEITRLVQTLAKQKQERDAGKMIALATGLVVFAALLESK